MRVSIILGIIFLSASILVGLSYFQTRDPYIQGVLSLQGDSERGQAIFLVNCAVCHGDRAHGNVGPSLEGISEHKSRIELINQVVSGKTPPMPKFQPSSQDMADLLSFLQNL